MGLSSGTGLSNGTGLSATALSLSLGAPSSGLAYTGGAGTPLATWSSTDSTSGMTFSGDLLTATAPNFGATFLYGRATKGVQAGAKKFWSIKVTVLPTGAANEALGIATDTFPFSGFIGADIHSAAQYENDARIFVNNVTTAVTNLWVLNSVVDFAVNRLAGLYWSRIDGGVWNAGGGADPATNTGGLDISILTGNQSPAILYPAYQLLGDGGGLGTIIGNFGASAYPFAAPAGYTNL